MNSNTIPARLLAFGTDRDPIAIGTRTPGEAHRRAARPNSRIGSVIGSYRLERRLGSGGTSVVYLAVDTGTGRTAAIKVMRRQLATDLEMVERFEQEAVLLSRIEHPGLPRLLGRGTSTDGSPYLVMELLLGQTLAERLDIGPMAVDDVLDIALQAAAILAAVHAVGVVHCDLKPDNLFLVPDPLHPSRYGVVLIDFGVAIAPALHPAACARRQRRVIGTPPYMAPEQLSAASLLDPRTDVYGFGCLVHEMLCGEAPFGGNIAEIVTAHRIAAPPRASQLRADVPAELDSLLLAMLAKDPAKRPPTMAVVRAGLDRIGATA
ncbi:MAG TPA: serine/threonine-protein kinase [Kofleriaceae bacterium]|nr:serine/threonine-protein kinase [Kofleriaceae bacterium]